MKNGEDDRRAVRGHCSRADGWRADAVRAGPVGILEIWESQRKTPGKRGVVFYYPLDEKGETSRYLQTTYSYDLSFADGIACFEKEGKRYRFRIDGAAEAR